MLFSLKLLRIKDVILPLEINKNLEYKDISSTFINFVIKAGTFIIWGFNVTISK
jgi:hypothetical protein